MKENISVRFLEKKDLGFLAYLYEQFWNDKSDIEKMNEQFDIIEKEHNHIILVAEKENVVVGSVMGIVCKELYGNCEPSLLVENMIVDKEYRKMNIGTLLLSQLEKMATEQKCTQMILVTEIERVDACNFYEKYGFQKNNKGYKKKLY